METETQTELEKRIEELVLFSGCVSGDCPHEKWSDCAEHYQKLIKQFILEMPEFKAQKELLDEAELKARVHLFECIFKNIEEVGLEETIDWMRSRLNFERDKLRAVKGEK